MFILLVQVFSQRVEQFIDILPGLGRRLIEIIESFFLHALCPIFKRYLSEIMVCQIHPVTNEIDQHIVLISIFLDLIEPRAHIVKGFSLCHIVHHYRSLTIFVK